MPRARNPRRIDAPVPQQHRGAVELEAIAVGQNQRTVLEDTNKLYISKCRVMTRILNELEGVDASGDDVRAIALELDVDGNAMEHTGVTVGVYRMNFPILSSTAKLLFAALSVDTSLPKQKIRAYHLNRIAGATRYGNFRQHPSRGSSASNYQQY